MVGLNAQRNNHVIGRGDLFFAERRADGTLKGERLIGNTPNFAIQVSSESVQHYSSARGMRVQDRDVPIQTNYAATFTTDDVNPKNLAALFLGAVEVEAVTALAAQTETIEDVEQGLFYQVGITAGNPTGLQQIDITAVKVGVATKVEGTDYRKDDALGRVEIIDGGTIADGADIIIEYDRLASNQERVASGASVVEGSLRFVAYNPEGDDTDYFIEDAKLAPNGDVTIKNENDWQMLPFRVSINTPLNGSAVLANGRAWTP
jgi:hypothetical protein